MADQQDVLTWGAVGLAVLSWAPKFFAWVANQFEGNRAVKVKENDQFKDFLLAQVNAMKEEINQLRLDLEDCQDKHADAERRVIEVSAKLDLLATQHNQILRNGKEMPLDVKGVSVSLKTGPEELK